MVHPTQAWPEDEDCTCPICLEGGAKATSGCATCSYKYHPSCLAEMEESGVALCPTCREPLPRKQKKRATPPRRLVGPLVGPPFEAAGAALCTSMAMLMIYCALGVAGAWIGYVWDVEYNFRWIYPRDPPLPFNESLVMIRDHHADVSDRDWGGVVQWIKESERESPVSVVVTSGLTFSATSEFLADATPSQQDFVLTPKTCYGTEDKCLNLKETNVSFVHANFMRRSLDASTSEFALQAFYGLLVCVALYGAALAAARMCQGVPLQSPAH